MPITTAGSAASKRIHPEPRSGMSAVVASPWTAVADSARSEESALSGSAIADMGDVLPQAWTGGVRVAPGPRQVGHLPGVVLPSVTASTRDGGASARWAADQVKAGDGVATVALRSARADSGRWTGLVPVHRPWKGTGQGVRPSGRTGTPTGRHLPGIATPGLDGAANWQRRRRLCSVGGTAERQEMASFRA